MERPQELRVRARNLRNPEEELHCPGHLLLHQRLAVQTHPVLRARVHPHRPDVVLERGDAALDEVAGHHLPREAGVAEQLQAPTSALIAW